MEAASPRRKRTRCAHVTQTAKDARTPHVAPFHSECSAAWEAYTDAVTINGGNGARASASESALVGNARVSAVATPKDDRIEGIVFTERIETVIILYLIGALLALTVVGIVGLALVVGIGHLVPVIIRFLMKF